MRRRTKNKFDIKHAVHSLPDLSNDARIFTPYWREEGTAKEVIAMQSYDIKTVRGTLRSNRRDLNLEGNLRTVVEGTPKVSEEKTSNPKVKLTSDKRSFTLVLPHKVLDRSRPIIELNI